MKEQQGKCKCPFCDTEIEFPFCKICSKELVRCQSCGQLIEKDITTCPKCAEKF
jgi:hypothetical protein